MCFYDSYSLESLKKGNHESRNYSRNLSAMNHGRSIAARIRYRVSTCNSSRPISGNRPLLLSRLVIEIQLRVPCIAANVLTLNIPVFYAVNTL